ncbi:HAL/PAL/TAL family ammonia-lyase [Christiangramia portivictoriae]|uniref:HAL/PAL/TAL family ammonia-lyase n=1 Tax=Christiangramia portivictoriae TaxID=326069 RepID=UPI0004240255|nr:aromatic amino acid ammonia-lyase [Christiangramia portivictoriae]
MITLDKELTLSDFQQVVLEQTKVQLSIDARNRMIASHQFLEKFSQNKVIYGVNTGFGPMAQYRVANEDAVNLQLNLIRSHASGAGAVLSKIDVRALMLARLNTLSLGKSGIDISVADVLIELLNLRITPLIFEHGGVGASGDLVQLAHLALVLIGEGEVFYNGERRNTSQVFQEMNIKPAKISIREGLAIMNGTSAMTGIGLVNTLYAEQLLNWSVFCSSVINEIVKAYDDHLSEELNRAKLHKGQQQIAALMRKHLNDSGLTRSRKEDFYNADHAKIELFKEKVQEYYSLRCVPQVLGPVKDTLSHTSKILLEEVNSANDNPIIDVETEQVYHGGNFHGDYISLEMDKLRLVMTKMSMLAERQINYLLNPKLNDILPAFVNASKLGLNFGMQGAQFPAVSTTAENQMLSNSMYVHSIPNNNDNQDIVSMGANSALMTRKVIDNCYEVLATQIATILQALYILDYDEHLSSATSLRISDLRKIFPQIKEDRVLYEDMKRLKDYLKTQQAYD